MFYELLMDIFELTKNINQVKSNIDAVCERCQIKRKVLLVGASKTMGQDVIDMVDKNKLLEVLGENRVQELTAKYRNGQNFEWHFIGKLQSNKVKYIVDKVSLIHSVDSVGLAKEIDKQAKKHNLVSKVLLQINMGREISKSGFYIEQIEKAIEEVAQLPNVKVEGIMAVMPICDRDKTIELFKELNAKWIELKDKYNYKYLSAGMTSDYELAIEYAGANIVRIGTAIFGKRSYDGKV